MRLLFLRSLSLSCSLLFLSPAALPLLLPGTAEAALKAVYSVPRHHLLHPPDTASRGSQHASREFGDSLYYQKGILPGLWEGWQDRHGFEAFASGPSAAAPFADAAFWIDSLCEPSSPGAYTANVHELKPSSVPSGLRPSGGTLLSGYIVYFAGALSFPKEGNYVLLSNGDDGGTPFSLDTNFDGRFDLSERSVPVESLKPGNASATKNGSSAPGTAGGAGAKTASNGSAGPGAGAVLSRIKAFEPFDARLRGKNRILVVRNAKPGRYYRFEARYYNHSGSSQSALFWGREEDSVLIAVPASAFGPRRNFGAPAPRFTAVTVGGRAVPLSRWGFVEIPAGGAVAFKVETTGKVAGQKPLFLWDFGDGMVDTTAVPQAAHRYGRGFFTPSVRALWGKLPSEKEGNRILVHAGTLEKGGRRSGRLKRGRAPSGRAGQERMEAGRADSGKAGRPPSPSGQP